MLIRSNVTSFRPLKPYNTVIFDTWHDGNREPDIVGGLDTCKHLSVTSSKCDICGAFVGYIGCEKDPIDFYNHVLMLAHFVYSDSDFWVFSDRIIPKDYKLKVFYGGIKSRHYRQNLYFKKEDLFLNLFSLSPFTQTNLELWNGFFKDFILMKSVKPVLVLNPRKWYFCFGYDYVVTNKVLDYFEWIS